MQLLFVRIPEVRSSAIGIAVGMDIEESSGAVLLRRRKQRNQLLLDRRGRICWQNEPSPSGSLPRRAHGRAFPRRFPAVALKFCPVPLPVRNVLWVHGLFQYREQIK